MPDLNQVILVEGDSGFAADLERVLASHGARVVVCDNTEAMMASIEDVVPDLIMLSVELPQGKGAGYLACNKLKKNPDTQSLPVVLMSSQATEEDFAKHRKLKTHADDYLRKPFSDDDLLKKLENLLGFEIGGGEFEKLQQQVHDFLEEKTHLEAEIREKATRITELEHALEEAHAAAQKAADAGAAELKGDVKKLKAAYDKLQEENARLSGEAEQAEKQRDDALQAAEAAGANLENIQQALDAASESLGAMQKDVEEATNRLFEEQERLAATQEELGQADTALEQRRSEQVEIEGRLEEMRDELDGLEQQLEPLQSSMEELKMREAELRGERDSHEARLAKLQEEIETAETEKSALEKQLADQQAEQAALTSNLKDAGKKQKSIRAQIEKLVKIHARLQEELASMQEIVDDDGTD